MNIKDFDKRKNKSLDEIAGWIKENSEVKIPAIQRGLVWKPKQIELLWDSILRGFPIGTFILAETVEGSAHKYDLMDGQQRFNSIALGYNIVLEPSAILWIDINPKKNEKSTRRYWIKVTTKAHPWGYNNDDDCQRLNARQQYDALSKFNSKIDDFYNKGLNLHKTYPVCAVKPLPLYYLLLAPTESENEFVAYVEQKVKDNDGEFCYVEQVQGLNDDELNQLKGLYPVFKALKEYTIGTATISREVIEREEQGDIGNTTLEVLFNRLNTGGTQISQEDLQYSAIKAYWEEIREENDDISKLYMPSPAKLAILTFRMVLSENEFEPDISIAKIRSLAYNEQIKGSILCLYDKENTILRNIVKKIEDWLDVSDKSDATPKVIRTSIAVNSPDVYLLLMWFAYRGVDMQKEFIKALTLYLHWFAQDSRKCVKLIFQRCKKFVTKDNIYEAISDAIQRQYLIGLYSPEYFYELKKTIEKNNHWSIWDASPWMADLYNRIAWLGLRQTEEMLLFAQREYLNAKFKAYDPARKDLWEGHNRPWDFDHIIPKDWIVNKRTSYREYCKIWLNNIGNIAAIPFAINRSKSNCYEYKEYELNAESLMFRYNEGQINDEVTSNSEMAYDFAKETHKRCCEIYKRCYDEITPILTNPIPSNSDVARRKKLYLNIRQHLNEHDCNYYFVSNDGTKEYRLKEEIDWCRCWLSVGVIVGDKYMASFTSTCKDDNGNAQYEIGLRRLPETSDLQKNMELPIDEDNRYIHYVNNNGWWYLERMMNEEEVNAEAIATELQELIRASTK